MTVPAPPGAPLARQAAVAALTAAAACAFSPLFSGTAHLPVLLGATAVPFALTALALALPLSRPDTPPPRSIAWLRAPLCLAGTGLVAVLGAHPGPDLADGPMRLLTGALPLDPAGPELATVALAAGVAATAGAELAVRVRQPLAAAVPALLCLLLALALGASGGQPPAPLPAALVAGVGAILGVAVLPGGRRVGQRQAGPRLAGASAANASGRGRLAGAATLVMVSTLLAWTIVDLDLAPGASARGRRFDARDLVAEQVLPKTALSPLAAFADLRAARTELLFTVRADRPVERLRVATLTGFDGHLWSAVGPHLRAGRVLPGGPASGGEPERARLQVEVADSERATWLPTLGASGRAVEVSVPGLGVDPATGDLVVPTDRQVPSAYQVVSEEPVVPVTALRGGVAARVPVDALPQASVLDRVYLPAVRGAVARADTSFGEVAALNAYFSRDGGFARDDGNQAPSGHGLSQIERLLRTRRGTAEQYASAFAVLAQGLGYDARVAVGFKLASPVPAGEPVTVTGASVHAWPEVRFEGLGWVPFEPTPTAVRPRKPPTAAPSAADQVEAAVDQEVTKQKRGGERADEPPLGPQREGAPLGRLALLALAGIAAAAALGMLVVPLAKSARRRWRRRSTAPGPRVVTAWDEAVDRLIEHGVPVDAGMTSGELTAASVRRFGRERTAGLAELAELADTARFAAEGADARQAATAWALCDRLRHALGAGIPAHRRVRHALDPRPLTGRLSVGARSRRR
jgi:transglutaminase-like putative cysteine protease